MCKGDKIKCDCGWKGYEKDLVVDYYENYTNANAIPCCCPKCGSDACDYDFEVRDEDIES